MENKDVLASKLIDFKASIASGQEFNRENIHLFCSPLFVKTMTTLYDKNIQTTSCGSGKERGILPGITCNFESLSDENKKIAERLLISPSEFRIGSKIDESTTFAQFEKAISEIAETFLQQ